VFGASPGSSNGSSEVFDDDALIPEVLPPVGPDAVVVPLVEAVDDDPTEVGAGLVGNGDVGMLSGSVPEFPVVTTSRVVVAWPLALDWLVV
jgi:hypothetical protein